MSLSFNSQAENEHMQSHSTDQPLVFKAIKVNFNQHPVMSRWMMALAGDYALAAFAFLMAGLWGWVAVAPALLLLGIAQHRIGILGHDAAHGMICRNKRLNDLIGQFLCFWPLLFDIEGYRKFHWDHHRHTGQAGLDPELDLKKNRYQLPKTKRQLYGRFLLDLCGGSIGEFVEMSVYMAKRSNPLWSISFLATAFTACFLMGHTEFFILFMVSKPTAFWAVFRLRIYIEHVGEPLEGTHRVELAEWQKFLFAPHNTSMHWEHHKHPQVPFWQLPAVREQYKNVPVITFDELLRWNDKAVQTEREETVKRRAMAG